MTANAALGFIIAMGTLGLGAALVITVLDRIDRAVVRVVRRVRNWRYRHTHEPLDWLDDPIFAEHSHVHVVRRGYWN